MGGCSISDGILDATDFTKFNEEILSSGTIEFFRTEISSRSNFIIFNIAMITLRKHYLQPKQAVPTFSERWSWQSFARRWQDQGFGLELFSMGCSLNGVCKRRLTVNQKTRFYSRMSIVLKTCLRLIRSWSAPASRSNLWMAPWSTGGRPSVVLGLLIPSWSPTINTPKLVTVFLRHPPDENWIPKITSWRISRASRNFHCGSNFWNSYPYES